MLDAEQPEGAGCRGWLAYLSVIDMANRAWSVKLEPGSHNDPNAFNFLPMFTWGLSRVNFSAYPRAKLRTPAAFCLLRANSRGLARGPARRQRAVVRSSGATVLREDIVGGGETTA